MGQLKRLN